MSVDIAMTIAEIRQKSRDGTVTLEETKQAIALLREGRIAAAASSSKARAAKAKPQIDVGSLLSDLDNL